MSMFDTSAISPNIQTLVKNGFPADSQVVLAGLTNDYSSYISTFEEYQVLYIYVSLIKKVIKFIKYNVNRKRLK